MSARMPEDMPEHIPEDMQIKSQKYTRRRMARERRGGSFLVNMETQFYTQYIQDVL